MLPFLVVAVAPLACSPSMTVRPEASADPAPALAPLPYEVQLVGGATEQDRLPLVVTLHGRGSDPVRFQRFFADLGFPARIVHLEAPVEEHDGRAWFSFRGKDRATLQAEVDELADRAVLTTEQLRARLPSYGKPALVGFSQGSMVVYTMLVRHPAVFDVAVPVAGAYFGTRAALDDGAELPPVIAMHGLKDPVMSPGSSAAAVDALRRAGFPAELRTFPDAVHWISGDLKRALHDALRPSGATGDPATGG